MPTTKITKGKSFSKAVRYDLEKGTNKDDLAKINRLPATKDEAAVKGFAEGQRARLLATNVIGDAPAELAAGFERVAAQRTGIKEPVHKVSISLKPGEHLETHQWLKVGHSYLKAMGYADSPFLIVQHREKDQEHIHIVASRVDFNGKVFPIGSKKKRSILGAFNRRAIQSEPYTETSRGKRADASRNRTIIKDAKDPAETHFAGNYQAHT